MVALLLSMFLFVLAGLHPANAQGILFNAARTLIIDDKDAVTGDIVSLGTANETVSRSKKIFDERMYGVLVVDPIILYRTLSTLPVVHQGDVVVNVTLLGGPILVGDYITSSPLAGKGQKAEGINGYMLGIALTNFDGKNTTTSVDFEGKKYPTGTVKVSVGIGPASPVLMKTASGLLGSLQQLAGSGLFKINVDKQAEKVVRYVLAILISIIIISVNYRLFGHNVTTGIEAMGRNPLAKQSIQAMIVFNIILLALSCIAGVILSLVIISL